ncbi:DoxX family protein [Novosphingobium sp. Gsoil 351]|uniref:DoxX family protein n=1 Tax=Novosphingobium sp. Gsoil 351 TaxID=2675225 RepID=UPI0012B4FC4F|nr:DoxX family protein [Novosphingobium sp. Gsoil 351]QGN54542.1 DoxX family membrane protein [Novosphingobium sp. Gsoil 351]
MNVIAAVIGRIFIALLFLYSGATKLFNPAAAEAMITGAGLPNGLAIPTGIFEVVAALCLIIGFMTRLASILLAGFVALTIVFFHNDLTTMPGAITALSHLALIGGLLCLFAHSQMRWSYDSMRLTRRAEIAERDAAAKVHEAELRAAKAEAHAEGLRTAPVAPAPVVAAPVVAAPVIDRNRDGIDDRDQRAVPAARHDMDRDGIDDRAEAIDPRLRP